MENPKLTDQKIMLITKVALDNNAAIIQYCSFIFGNTGSVKPGVTNKWNKDLRKIWREYKKQIDEILEIPNENLTNEQNN